MGGEKHGLPLGEAAENTAKPDTLLGVQARRGLVQNQELRVSQQRLGNSDALALAAGEALELFLGFVLQAHQPEQLVRLLLGLKFRESLQAGDIEQKLFGSEVGIDPEVLGQVAQLLPKFHAQGGNIPAIQQHPSGAGLQQVGHNPHQRRFSCAVGPQQAVDAVLQGQIDLFQGHGISVELADVFQRQSHSALRSFLRYNASVSPPPSSSRYQRAQKPGRQSIHRPRRSSVKHPYRKNQAASQGDTAPALTK